MLNVHLWYLTLFVSGNLKVFRVIFWSFITVKEDLSLLALLMYVFSKGNVLFWRSDNMGRSDLRRHIDFSIYLIDNLIHSRSLDMYSLLP